MGAIGLARVIDSQVPRMAGFTRDQRDEFGADAADLPALRAELEFSENAVLVVDRRARLRFANSEARRLIDEGRTLALDHLGTLHCRDDYLNRGFRDAVREAIETGSRRSGPVFSISRETGWPMVATFSGQTSATPDESCVVITIRDPERRREDTATRIAELFGLSLAEAIVVDSLAAGESLEQIAMARGVSLVTVRSQLKSAFAKIGVSRQAELVSIVLRMIG